MSRLAVDRGLTVLRIHALGDRLEREGPSVALADALAMEAARIVDALEAGPRAACARHGHDWQVTRHTGPLDHTTGRYRDQEWTCIDCGDAVIMPGGEWPS